MNVEPLHHKDMSIAECEVCSKLSDFEYSFEKHGWPEQTRRLPIEASRLEPAEDIEARGKEHDHIKRCPLCGTFYHYTYSYDYLVNGSEDSEDLERLTPTEARGFLGDEEYDRLIEAMGHRLSHPSALARHFAARSLVSHHLERGEYALIQQYLTHTDADVVKGAVRVLARLVARGGDSRRLSSLKPALHQVSTSTDPDVAASARYILTQIERVEASPAAE